MYGWLTTTRDVTKQERRTAMIFMAGFVKDAVIGRKESTLLRRKVF
jgi:hypothetical protein